jgi:flagellar hook assembly protein FlgD
MHQINVANSFYVPFVQTYNPSSIQIPFETIGNLLGLTEDVSPEIKYDIDFNADVTVVVYSTRATVVATIFSGRQIPGHYEFKWNFRDDNGRLMPSGDYVAEVRVGNYKFIRKKITIP